MIDRLTNLVTNKAYWSLLLFIAIGMEAVALYFQYALGEWPCVLCIHVRIWLMALLMVSVASLFLKKISYATIFSHGLISVIWAALLERSWNLLGVERGTIFGSCDMDLGMPAWFAIDKWMPLIFEVKTACGYTPELFFKITMAEALMALSSIMLVISFLFLGTSILKKYQMR